MASINNETLKECNSDSQSSVVINIPPKISTGSIHTRPMTSIARKHILVVGPIGSGKTSLINILSNNGTIHAGQPLGEPTKNVYMISQLHENVEYVFIDTPGFGGLSTNLEDDPDNPFSKLCLYLASRKNRFDCVLFVWKKDRIHETLIQGFKLLKNRLIIKSTPFILVLTACETEDDIESMIDSIKEGLREFNFDQIVGGTTLKSKRFEEDYRDMREKMCLDLWRYIIELCAKPIEGTDDDLKEPSDENTTLTLWDLVMAAWGLLQTAVSYGKGKLTAYAPSWLLMEHDGSTREAQLSPQESSTANDQTDSTRDQDSKKPRLA